MYKSRQATSLALEGEINMKTSLGSSKTRKGIEKIINQYFFTDKYYVSDYDFSILNSNDAENDRKALKHFKVGYSKNKYILYALDSVPFNSNQEETEYIPEVKQCH